MQGGSLLIVAVKEYWNLGPVCLLENSFLLESEFRESEFRESIFQCLVV
jgi:hypothetical protein